MGNPQTMVYSTVGDLDIHVDIYIPPQSDAAPNPARMPAVIFFHGGGLIRGGRENIIPEMKDDVLAKRWLFISADHRLLFPCSAHEILQDLHALWRFLPAATPLDPTAVFVAGHSGGAYVARLAGAHCAPKPRGLLSVSGQGGSLLSPAYFSPQRLSSGVLKRHLFKEFLSGGIPAVSNVPWSWSRAAKILPPAKNAPANEKRAALSAFLAQEGLKLDFLLGCPGVSAVLREAWDSDRGISEEALAALVPDKARTLLPELWIEELPPCWLVHGTGDGAVSVEESRKTARQIRALGRVVVEVLVPGWGHGFDGGVYEREVKGVVKFFEELLVDAQGR